MIKTMRFCATVALCAGSSVLFGCAGGGGGGGGGGGQLPPGTVQYEVDTGEAGTIAVTEGEPAAETASANLGAAAPAETVSGTASVRSENVQFLDAAGKAILAHQPTGREAQITIHIAPAGAADPCAAEFEVLAFTAIEQTGADVELGGTTSAALTGEVLEAVAADNFVFCIQVVANFAGTIAVSTVDVTLTGATDGGEGEGEGEGEDFFRCSSPGGEDLDVEFGEPGTTRVLFSTIGNGRHMVLANDWDLVYQFDQPVRFCAVVPEHFTLTDTTTGAEIPLTESNLVHTHLTRDGVVVAGRVTILLPDEVKAGNDYELVISATGLSLDGEFQQNAGTARASNGTLPSGDGTPGGDFVQIFRAVGATTFLTDTREAGGMALDAADRLYLVGENGVFGPFDSARAVEDGDQLGSTLGLLAPRTIAVDNDGRVIVKENLSDGGVFEIDPTTRLATQITDASGLHSVPNAIVIAPDGYANVERSGVEPGDIIVSDDAELSVLDPAAGTGPKGGLHLVERGFSFITDAYVSLYVPPDRPGRSGEIYGAYRPEDSAGFEMHRILPNGTVDRTVFTDPPFLAGIEGTSATQLEDIQGREEFAILGTIDLDVVPTGQVLPDAFFTSRAPAIMVYNKTEDRMQVLFPLDLSIFAFTFEAFSQVVLTPDLDTAYVSLPDSNAVVRFTGLANGDAAAGDPPCGTPFEDNVAPADTPARLVRSTIGSGRHLLKGSPTVLEFEFDVPIRLCSVTPDNITLTEAASGTAIPLNADALHRVPVMDRATGVVLAGMIVVDLPNSLTAGTTYELTLSADGLDLDGNVVQTFQLIEGANLLTETRGASGLTLGGDGEMYIASGEEIYGPFAEARAVTAADRLDNREPLSDEGRPIVVDNDGNLIYVGLRNGEIHMIDPATGTDTELLRSRGGSFEVGLVVLPEGFNAPVAGGEPGDLMVANFGRGFIPDFVAGTDTILFNDATVGREYVDFSVPPVDLFGPQILAGLNDGAASSFEVRNVLSDGSVVNVFQPLLGVTGYAVAR
ncbi:MAG: NHL repeat-containing protein, partial [Planctomycetota bacterium]